MKTKNKEIRAIKGSLKRSMNALIRKEADIRFLIKRLEYIYANEQDEKLRLLIHETLKLMKKPYCKR